MLKRRLASLAALLALSAGLAASPALAGPVRTGHLTAELAAATQGVAPGGEVQLVLRCFLAPPQAIALVMIMRMIMIINNQRNFKCFNVSQSM